MLPNYDAKAVAEVMGIAFLRRQHPSSASASAKAAKSRSKSPARSRTRDLVAHADDATVLIVATDTNNKSARSRPSNGGTHRNSDRSQDVITPPSPALIEQAVERGLPRTALRHVAEQLAGSDKSKIVRLEWGVVPRTTLERREKLLSPQESERTERVARLFVHARRALGTEAEAREFMTTPHPLLDGRSPMDTAKSDLGTRRAEQILNALEYGLAL